MYSSIKFKIYVIKNNQRILLNTAVVEDISFHANEFNTATFSIIVNDLDAEELPDVSDRILIYAYGNRAKGNDFTDNFLNKNHDEYYYYMKNNPIDDYEILLFAGTIEGIEANLETNMFSRHFVFRYIFNCVGLEKILANLSNNSYLFYDTLQNKIIEVAGIPSFRNNCYKQETIRAFTTDGLGSVWTKADLLQYTMNTIISPFNDVVFSIEYSSGTLNDLLSLPVHNVRITDYRQLLDILCGQLFNYYFTYTEDENEIITLHIRIISHASNDDTVSFINLHGTMTRGVQQRPIEQLILTYPLIAPIEGIFKIYRHPDNVNNEALYTLTNEDIEYCKAIYGEEAVYDEGYLNRDALNIAYQYLGFNALVPERVDECLRNSSGHKLGVHRKFFLHPLFNLTINGVNYVANLEEYEILELNALLKTDNSEPLLWVSNKPFSNIVITMEGNQVDIDCDIPHQIAPNGYEYPHSNIEMPVFPINDGDEVFLSCLGKSTISRKYVTVGSGLEKKLIDIEQALTDEQASVLANYLYSFYSAPLRTFTLSGTMMDWLIDYYFCFSKKLDILHLIGRNENQSNPFSDEIPINLLTKSFSINRTGSVYTFSLTADLANIDLSDVINAMLYSNTIPSQKSNTIKINGNINGTFIGKIINTHYNHYEVLPQWAENENDTIDVARVDELKLGYWRNNPPSEDISFEVIAKEGGGCEPSRRIEIIKSNGVEQERLENVVVPSEELYPTIEFKIGREKLLVIKRISQDPPEYRFLKFIDVNTYSRTFAELVE